MKKIVYGLFIVLTVGICLTGCGKKEQGNTSDNFTQKDNNISISRTPNFDNTQLIVMITNNNDKTLGIVDVKYSFKDNDGTIIEEDTESIYNFGAKAKYVTYLDLPVNDDGEYYVPDKVELEATIDEEYQSENGELENYTSYINATSQRDGNDLNVTLTNTSDSKMAEVFAVAVFKKDDKPIATRSFVTDSFESSYVETVEIPTYEEDGDDPIDYDSVEIVINDATELFEIDETEENE